MLCGNAERQQRGTWKKNEGEGHADRRSRMNVHARAGTFITGRNFRARAPDGRRGFASNEEE
jgi:hypothetical protein